MACVFGLLISVGVERTIDRQPSAALLPRRVCADFFLRGEGNDSKGLDYSAGRK